jgi:hypothetical protein
MAKETSGPGRKKQLDVAGWKMLSVQLPTEVWRALRRYCFENEKKQAAIIREQLERFLEGEGLLKVKVTTSPEGREVRSYELTKQ